MTRAGCLQPRFVSSVPTPPHPPRAPIVTYVADCITVKLKWHKDVPNISVCVAFFMYVISNEGGRSGKGQDMKGIRVTVAVSSGKNTTPALHQKFQSK